MPFPTGWQGIYDIRLPAQIAGATGANIGMRENLMDPIVILDPTDTPVLNMLPKEDWPVQYAEWMVDALPTIIDTSTGAVVDGEDWGSSDTTAAISNSRTRLRNVTQINRVDFAVTRGAIKASQSGFVNGVRNEYQYTVFKYMKNLMRSIDARMTMSGTAAISAIGSATAARRTTVIRGFPGIKSTAVSGAFATATYASLHQDLDAAGADIDTMFVTSSTKANISSAFLSGAAFTGAATANGSSLLRRFNQDAFQKEVSTIIDVMEDDFGRVVLVRDRWMPQYTTTGADAVSGLNGAYILMDRSKVKFGFFQHPDHFPLPPNGDSQRGYVLAEWGVKILHPSAIGVGYGVIDNVSQVY